MSGACAVAAPSPPATVSGPGPGAAPPGHGFRVSCRRSARRGGGGLRTRVSRDANGADAEAGSKGKIPQDDSGYLLTLGLGSVGGAAAIKYGSVLLPDITRPNIVEALLMVSLPMAAAALILLNLSSTKD